MPVFVEHCLCFRETKESSYACGVFTLVTRILFLTVVTVLLSENIRIMFIEAKGRVIVTLDMTTVLIADSAILIPLSIALLYGIKTVRRYYALPWVIFMAIEVVGCIIIAVVLMAMAVTETSGTKVSTIVISVFSLIFWACFNFYLILCVLSHYKVMAGIIILRHHIDPEAFNYYTFKS